MEIFCSGKTFVVNADNSRDICGQLTFRVDTFLLGNEADSRQIQTVQFFNFL